MDFLKKEARRKTRKEKRKNIRIKAKENSEQLILRHNFSADAISINDNGRNDFLR